MKAEPPPEPTRDLVEFIDLLRRYAGFLDAIERGYDDCIEEYINDTDMRTLLQNMLDAGFEPPAVVLDRLRALDEQFRSFLKPITGFLGLGTEDREVYFWRYGLPRNMTGELLRDAVDYGYAPEDWPARTQDSED